MQRIAIMGCGWLGLPLSDFLVQRGFQVKGSTTRKERIPIIQQYGAEAYHLLAERELKGDDKDIAAFFSVDTLVINIPPGGRRNPDAAREHPQQVRAVVQAARNGGVSRILFVSSTGVYSDSKEIITEADQPDPVTASGRALAEVEQWLRQQADFQITILRLAGLVGGERKAGRFLAGKVNVPDGAAPVNLIHREDCVRIIFEIIRQEKWGEVLNACADEHPTRREFYTYQALKEGLTPPIFAQDDGKPKGKRISNTKVKKLLDYQFLYPNLMEI